jgi:hypothetical protein
MIVDPARLNRPTFNLREYFPEFGWNASHDVDVPSEGVVITDPTYIADVYNSDDPVAAFLRLHGTFIYDIGGDCSAPVWLADPFVVMPVSVHYEDEPVCPDDAIELVTDVGCDSGSFVLLPFSNLPADVHSRIRSALDANNAHLLQIPPAQWSLKFEQFDPPQPNMLALCRNIVLQRQCDVGR